MWLLDKLRTNMPGSPVRVAKTMLHAYTTYKTSHPSNSKSDALRYTLESRYQIFKLMKPEEMKSILSEADTLGRLVFLVVAHENPAAAHPANMKRTVLDLYEFFRKNAPDELGGLDALKAIVSVSEQKDEPDKNVQELMKSLCLGIVGDTGRLLLNKGFDKPIKLYELIIFGMFVVTEAYTLAKKGLDKASPQLDQFHLDMVNYVTNEYFLKETTAKDVTEILEFRDQFYDDVGSRYVEYRQLFVKDLSNRNPGAVFFSKSLSAFVNHLFIEPISKDDKPHLIIPMAIKLAEFYEGCLQSFKQI